MEKNRKDITLYKLKFEVISKLGFSVSTTYVYWKVITTVKHPTLKSQEKSVKLTISDPDEIRLSKRDHMVFLFYRKIKKRYLCVVVKQLNERGFIVTAYWTDKIKEGE